jgi:hypothetical protein
MIISEFQRFGNITDHVTTQGNLIFLKYQNPYSVKSALQLNGIKIIFDNNNNNNNNIFMKIRLVYNHICTLLGSELFPNTIIGVKEVDAATANKYNLLQSSSQGLTPNIKRFLAFYFYFTYYYYY